MPTLPSHRLSTRFVLPGLLVLLAVGTASSTTASGPPYKSGPDTLTNPNVGSVKSSPGYTPPVDPEASSELLGRRTNAPIVNKPFVGGAPSLRQFGRTVARLLQHQRRDSLELLCVRSDEFRDILWPEFPQSRPATGIQWEDAWFFLQTRNHKGCGQAINDWGGQPYHFIGVTCDSTLQYKNFKMYSRLKIVVRDANANTVKWDWVKASVARKSQYKILSLRD